MARTSNVYLTKRIKRTIEVNERIEKTGSKLKPKNKGELYVNSKLAKKLLTRQRKAQRRAKQFMQGKGER